MNGILKVSNFDEKYFEECEVNEEEVKEYDFKDGFVDGEVVMFVFDEMGDGFGEGLSLVLS